MIKKTKMLLKMIPFIPHLRDEWNLKAFACKTIKKQKPFRILSKDFLLCVYRLIFALQLIHLIAN
jgi:hypothetical protein